MQNNHHISINNDFVCTDDGDEDVVVAANVGPAVFYENIGGNNKDWLRIQVLHRSS